MATALRALSFPLLLGWVLLHEFPSTQAPKGSIPFHYSVLCSCHHLSAGNTGTGGRVQVEAPDAREPAEVRGPRGVALKPFSTLHQMEISISCIESSYNGSKL